MPGHTQRGGSPCAYDRVLATRLGAEAARAILEGDFGCMVGTKNQEIIRVPLSEVAGKLKYVDPKASIIKEAKPSVSASAMNKIHRLSRICI